MCFCRDVLDEFCEPFHDLEEDVKNQVMIEVEKVLSLQQQLNTSIVVGECSKNKDSADGSSRGKECQNIGELLDTMDRNEDSEVAKICIDEGHEIEKENEEQYEEETALLQSLLPDLEIHAGVKKGFLLNVLQESNYNIQVAADKILENPKIEADIAAWENRQKGYSHKQSHRDTSMYQVDPGLKKSIVSKYHLQPVPSSTSNGKSNSRMKVPLYAEDDSGKGRVRFRENVVVSNKGEKYIVEKPPEWDGGSRGKVKSKRKGGKGFY